MNKQDTIQHIQGILNNYDSCRDLDKREYWVCNICNEPTYDKLEHSQKHLGNYARFVDDKGRIKIPKGALEGLME